jgi:hypothetical protein
MAVSDTEWIHRAPERAEWWVVVNRVMHLRIIQNENIFYSYLSGCQIVKIITCRLAVVIVVVVVVTAAAASDVSAAATSYY